MITLIKFRKNQNNFIFDKPNNCLDNNAFIFRDKHILKISNNLILYSSTKKICNDSDLKLAQVVDWMRELSNLESMFKSWYKLKGSRFGSKSAMSAYHIAVFSAHTVCTTSDRRCLIHCERLHRNLFGSNFLFWNSSHLSLFFSSLFFSYRIE